MERVELLTVEDCFQLGKETDRQVLILHPTFSVPEGGWKNISEAVVIARPDGTEIEATANLTMSHLRITDPEAPMDKRWRVVTWLTDRTKKEVPIGSKIMVAPRVKSAFGEGPTRHVMEGE